MAEYLVPVVVMSATLGIISYVSYPSASEKTVKFATTVLLLYTALTPLLSFVNNITADNFENYFGNLDYGNADSEGEYAIVAEEAFKEGVCKLLFTKYGIKSENITVSVFSFDFKEMKAEKIKILLSGDGAFSDFRGIEEYITESGLGECEVNVRIG